MNPLGQIDQFLHRTAFDDRLNPSHVSLCLAIFLRWEASGGSNPISATRFQLMRSGKINAIATYHKCIRDLQHFGYIRYMPSYHPYEGSRIELLPVGTCSENEQVEAPTRSKFEQVKVPTCSKNERVEAGTCSNNEHVEVPTRSKNEQVKEQQNESKNNVNIMKTACNPIDQPPIFANEPVQKMNRLKKTPPLSIYSNNIYNKRECRNKIKKAEIIAFFSAKKLPAVEAEKFYNYYQSNGWMVGKNPMKNWQAAARNWIIKMSQFTGSFHPPSGEPVEPAHLPGSLQATTDKDYSEPL